MKRRGRAGERQGREGKGREGKGRRDRAGMIDRPFLLSFSPMTREKEKGGRGEMGDGRDGGDLDV